MLRYTSSLSLTILYVCFGFQCVIMLISIDFLTNCHDCRLYRTFLISNLTLGPFLVFYRSHFPNKELYLEFSFLFCLPFKNKTKISGVSSHFLKNKLFFKIKNEFAIEWKRMSRNVGSTLPKILNRLLVKENSVEAELMKKIEECEEAVMDGESRFCATSLESLIDFNTSKLGRNVNVLMNEVKTGSQEFEFGVGTKKVADKSVVCHKMNYPYVVFYYHTLTKTRTYMIPLVGADGSKSKAMAACHSDTSCGLPSAQN